MEEYRYFGDVQTGKLVDLIFQLMSELSRTANRVTALEMLLIEAKVLPSDAVDRFASDKNRREALKVKQEEFLGRFMHIITESGPAEHPLRTQWAAQLGYDAEDFVPSEQRA
jgi:hypothetical protein